MGNSLPLTTLRTGAMLAMLGAGLLTGGDASAQQLATASRVSGQGTGAAAISGITGPGHFTPHYRPLPTAQYRLFDSLFNAFSYYSGGDEPLRYDAPSNTLVTIKRGPTGKSDDIFVRKSNDLGQTWTAPRVRFTTTPKVLGATSASRSSTRRTRTSPRTGSITSPFRW